MVISLYLHCIIFKIDFYIIFSLIRDKTIRDMYEFIILYVYSIVQYIVYNNNKLLLLKKF